MSRGIGSACRMSVRGALALGLAILMLLGHGVVLAHEVRPAYLELRESGHETYDVLWRVPGRGDDFRLALDVAFPSECRHASEPRGMSENLAFTERWRILCDGGLAGREVRIEGLAGTMTDVLVRVERRDGSTQVARLLPASPSFVVATVPGSTEVATTYFTLGVEHILTGIDHLLFVLGLVILVPGTRKLVWTVTAFTIAHSVTLAAATLGLVHVPQRPVEATIALSIVFVAREIVRTRKANARSGDVATRWPWVVAFAFGLLHGFGFAGALAEVGLPPTAIPLALLLFNVGVEAGQLLFITVALVASGLAVKASGRFGAFPRTWTRALAYMIGAAASFWLIQRIAAF